MRVSSSRAYASACVLLFASAALAVRPATWSFETEKDFAEGAFDNTVVDSYGQLSLSQKLTPVGTAANWGNAEAITAVAEVEGNVYAATGRDAKVYRVDAASGKITEVYKAPKGFSEITALAAEKSGDLLIALGGSEKEKARLVQFSPKDKATSTRFENEEVSDIWAMGQADDGTLYVGTGPHGKVYKVPAKGDATVVLETTARNVTALAFDGSQNLVAGTDAKGLVIRIDAKTQKPFVLLDAGKVDITAIVLDRSKGANGAMGDLFVATAKAEAGEDDSSGMEPELQGKPAKPEPELIEPTDDTPTPKKQGRATIEMPRFVLATPPVDLPPELKALLGGTGKKPSDKAPPGNPPTTGTKPSLPKKSKAPRNPMFPLEPEEESKDASAVYKIAANGTVSTLVQTGGQNFSLVQAGDDLLIGTGVAADETAGAGAKLFRYRASDESLSLLARMKQDQITSLIAGKDGDVLVGTANMAQLYRVSAEMAKTGTFTSQVLSSPNTASFGHVKMRFVGTPVGKVTVATRSGNTRSPADKKDAEKFWSEWSDELEVSPSSPSAKISSPRAKYLQYRVMLTAAGQAKAPVISSVKISYQAQNLAPRIKSVVVKDPGEGERIDRNEDAEPRVRPWRIVWDASDPNNDSLTYRIYYRQVGSEAKEEWVLLAKDVKESDYEWNTSSLTNGEYQVKVVGSDKADNTDETALETARVSAHFVVDHTPPAIGELKGVVDGIKAKVTGEATDEHSIVDVRYQIDSQGDWQPASPSDTLFDSPKETFTLVTRPLAAGAHRITVRATDSHGNSSYKAATVTVK